MQSGKAHGERELKRSDFTFGQFEENFTVERLADNEVCVGEANVRQGSPDEGRLR